MMLEHLIKCNDLWPRLEQNGLSKDDLIFIRELIVGPIDISDTAWPYKGRDIEKSFLYEVSFTIIVFYWHAKYHLTLDDVLK